MAKNRKVRYGKPSRYSNGPIGGTMTEFEVRTALQCKSADRLMKARCQGAEGHAGMCWAYDERGWLNQWKKQRDIKGGCDIACMHSPPGAPGYVSPEKKQAEYFRSFRKQRVIREFQDTEPLPPHVKRIIARAEKIAKRRLRKRA